MQTVDASQLQIGMDVFSREGEKMGTVSQVSAASFVIEKGFIVTSDLHLPTSVVTTVDEEGIKLLLTKDEIEEGGYDAPPPEADAPHAPDPMAGQPGR